MPNPSVSRYVRTLDSYPVAPADGKPQERQHGSTALSSKHVTASYPVCGPRAPPRQLHHTGPTTFLRDAASCLDMTGQSTPAPAAPPSSCSSTSTMAGTEVKEEDYRLSPEEVQRRAQQALTAQLRSLLEMRLQERLRQARVIQAQNESTQRVPSSLSAPSPVVSSAHQPAKPVPKTTVEEEVAQGSTANASSEQPIVNAAELPSLLTRALMARGVTARGHTASTEEVTDISTHPSSSITSLLDVHPYSAVELMRVHRLKGIPHHNRGLFAGLAQRRFVTRSGHFMVGRDGDGLARIRSGVAGMLWPAGHNLLGAVVTILPHPRLTLRSVSTDSHVTFQWTEEDTSSYVVFEEAEGPDTGEGGRAHRRGSDYLSLGRTLKDLLETKYGKGLTAEQKVEAARRLREKREGKPHGNFSPWDHTNGDYTARGAGAVGQVGLVGRAVVGDTAGVDGEDSFLMRQGSSGSDTAVSGRGSVLTTASPHTQRDTAPLPDSSRRHSRQFDAAPFSSRDHERRRGQTAFSGEFSGFATPNHRPISAEADSGNADAAGHGTVPRSATSLSSLGQTLPGGEAEMRRRKRHPRVGFVDSTMCSHSDLFIDSAVSDRSEGDVVGENGETAVSMWTPPPDSRPASSSERDVTEEHLRLSDTALASSASDRQSAGSPSRLFPSSAETRKGLPERNTRTSPKTGAGADKEGRKGASQRRAAPVAVAGAEIDAAGPASRLSDGSAAASSSFIDFLAQASPLPTIGGEDEEQHLDDFLLHFPEEEEHVRLRRTAKNILEGLEEIWDDDELRRGAFPLPMFLNGGIDGGGVDGAKEDHKEGGAEEDEDDDAELITGFVVEEGALRAKFRAEAFDDSADLVAQRDALLAQVEAQRLLLRDFAADVHYLSVGQARTNRTAERYAIELTSEVNHYAKSHSLRLNRQLEVALEGEDGKAGELGDDDDDSVAHAAEGFLQRFGKERSRTVDVGCQVSDADLCYVDAAVRSTEEQLEDLFLHEKAVVNAVRLATVAVANILTFHASLEMESTCHECFYVFDKPRTLWPCGHTFCLPCLSNMYNRRGELICSECGSVCEVGFTPNVSVELIANYQMVYARDNADESVDSDSAQAEKHKGQTVEGVLRNLLNDLLDAQSSWSPPLIPIGKG